MRERVEKLRQTDAKEAYLIDVGSQIHKNSYYKI